MIRFYSKAAAALTVVLLATNHNLSSINALVSVCGSTYDDASLNCKEANPLCPTGDGCPADKPTCYGVPDDQCFSPTDSPTDAPLHICAATYDDAIANCQTNDQCLNSDTSLCSDETHACFTVSTFLCPTAGTPSPTVTSTSGAQDDSNADDSGSVPEDIKVCGTDYNDAAQNFCTNQRCPGLDGCEIGGCFTLPYMECSDIDDSSGVGMTTTTTPATESEGLPTLIDATQAVESCTPGGACSEAGSSCSDGTETCCGQTYPSLQCDCTDNGNGVLEYMCMATDSCMLPSCCQDGPPIGMPPPSEGTCDSMGAACDTDIEDDYCCFDFSGTGSYCTKSGGKMLTDENTTTTTTTMATDVIEPTTTDTTTPVPTPSNSSDVFTSAPVYNRFFCGATYELAEKNCLTAQPCPTQVGCSVPGEACFGISMERCMSSSPTGSPSGPDPTISPKPTQPSETKAPSANTFYCGANYTDAISQCVACPSGFATECPDGMSCFNGVQCSSSTLAPTPGSTTLDETTTTLATDPVVATDETTTLATTTGVSVGSTTATTAASSISGGDDLPEVLCCAGPNCPDDSIPCADLVAESIDFDPSNTLYCGVDYNDAKDNCYERTPCPSGFATDCPDDQSCFPVTSCETPPPTVSTSPTNVGGSDATSPPTPSPTKMPVSSAKPSWNLEDFNTDAATGDSGALSMSVSGIMKTLILCSVVLVGALML